MNQHDLPDLEALGVANLVGILVCIMGMPTLDRSLVVFLGCNLAALAACAARRSAVGDGAWLIDVAVIIAFDLPGMALWFVMSANWEPGIVLALGLNAAAYAMCRAIHERTAASAAKSSQDSGASNS